MIVVLYVLEFNTLYGTPLIYILVFGATFIKFLLDSQNSHPEFKSKPLICWDIIVLSLPAMLASKFIGIMANIIFPEWLIVLVFVAVMINDFNGT